MPLSRWLSCAALLASGAAALTIQPTNITQDDTALDIALYSGNTLEVHSTLQPLTASADNFPVIDYLKQHFCWTHVLLTPDTGFRPPG